MTVFEIGESVTRRVDVYDEHSRLRYGGVTDIYEKTSKYGHYPELYEVQWQDGTVEKGFLPHGLHRSDVLAGMPADSPTFQFNKDVSFHTIKEWLDILHLGPILDPDGFRDLPNWNSKVYTEEDFLRRYGFCTVRMKIG
jgi:hypothetical protein